jgi:hypothetical protein
MTPLGAVLEAFIVEHESAANWTPLSKPIAFG